MATATKRKYARIMLNGRECKTVFTLAERGFHAHVIANLVGLTVGQVYYRCRKVGLSTLDYRNGESDSAKVILKRFKVR